jgi:hypothetical protein
MLETMKINVVESDLLVVAPLPEMVSLKMFTSFRSLIAFYPGW